MPGRKSQRGGLVSPWALRKLRPERGHCRQRAPRNACLGAWGACRRTLLDPTAVGTAEALARARGAGRESGPCGGRHRGATGTMVFLSGGQRGSAWGWRKPSILPQNVYGSPMRWSAVLVRSIPRRMPGGCPELCGFPRGRNATLPPGMVLHWGSERYCHSAAV